jgi:hypothetical protein
MHGISVTRGLTSVAEKGSLIVEDRVMTLYSPAGRAFATAPISQVNISERRFGRSRVWLTVRDVRFTIRGADVTGDGPGWLDLARQTGFAARFMVMMERAGAIVRRR